MSETIKSVVKKDEPKMVFGRANLTKTEGFQNGELGYGSNIVESNIQTTYLPPVLGSARVIEDNIRIGSQFILRPINEQKALSHKFMIKKEINPLYNEQKEFLSNSSCMSECGKYRHKKYNEVDGIKCKQCIDRYKL